MILLSEHNPRTAIMTPPKCATTTLHDALCTPPFNGQSVVGPSATNPMSLDRHLRTWPNEAGGYRKVVAVRHPLARLVSLYLHLARWDAAHGRATPAFWFYANQVGRKENTDPFYAWNLSQWLDGVEYEHLVRVESLKADLEAIGLQIVELPMRNSSFKLRTWREFYDNALLKVVRDWAMPDCEKFGYLWPEDDANVLLT